MIARFKSVSQPLAALLATLTFGVVAASILTLFAESFWMLELLTHFRLQFLAVQTSLLLACLWGHRWILLAMLLPFTAIHAATVAPYWPRADYPAVNQNELELMTANLYGRNDEHARFIELARRARPDVLLLLEYTPDWAAALAPLEVDYPYRLVDERPGFFGMALFSRFPLVEARRVDLLGVPAIDAQLALGASGRLRLIGVHTKPPMSEVLARERNAQLDLVADLVVAETGPLIVTGDFNATPYSPVLSNWLERTALTDARRGRGFGISWPTSLPLLGIPIDHVFISEDFLVNAHYYGPAFGSDHYPVVTRLSLRGEQ